MTNEVTAEPDFREATSKKPPKAAVDAAAGLIIAFAQPRIFIFLNL